MFTNERNKTTELLTTNEIAKALKVSTRTILNWRDAKRITPLVIGRTVRYDWNSVINEIKTQQQGDAA